ncbi:unnamed protein product [Polarella glacialis]|uniref:Uncharacterized protein n=1 Tax=Polarella glacialis TaxID=89957 RepID=A0A813KVE4_POLGL|nr:unnamed protein product [Polarella glacialis]
MFLILFMHFCLESDFCVDHRGKIGASSSRDALGPNMSTAAALLDADDREVIRGYRVSGGIYDHATVREIEELVTDPWAVLSRLRGPQNGKAEIFKAYAKFLRSSHDTKIMLLTQVEEGPNNLQANRQALTRSSQYATTLVTQNRVRVNRQLILAPVITPQMHASVTPGPRPEQGQPSLSTSFVQCLQWLSSRASFVSSNRFVCLLVQCGVLFLFIGLMANPALLFKLCFRGGSSLSSMIVRSASSTVYELAHELLEDQIPESTISHPTTLHNIAGGSVSSAQTLLLLIMGWVYGNNHAT